ncbi:MAG: hypothetical protein HYX32_10680 [Actinobacteria bacterium]|nr:hypothetical protein [Actinomycetota bacterium]
MTPYEILGVEQDAPIDEVETSYRLMLRRFHPQSLATADPATKADAAIRTRELHSAMAQVRKDLRGGGPRTWGLEEALDDEAQVGLVESGGPGGETAVRRGASKTDPDWMHDDLLELVPCPYCGQGFLDLDPFRQHLAESHALRLKKRKRGRLGPSVLEVLGVGRCVVAIVLLLASLAVLLIGGPVWLGILGIIIVFFVLLSAALPKSSSGAYGKKRVKQHKAIRWF